MNSWGLSEKIISQLCDVFIKHVEIDKAILYGSRAKGNFTPGSDIDLTLMGKNLNLDKLNCVATEIDDLLLPYTVDLSIYQHIDSVPLIQHIDRLGQILFTRR